MKYNLIYQELLKNDLQLRPCRSQPFDSQHTRKATRTTYGLTILNSINCTEDLYRSIQTIIAKNRPFLPQRCEPQLYRWGLMQTQTPGRHAKNMEKRMDRNKKSSRIRKVWIKSRTLFHPLSRLLERIRQRLPWRLHRRCQKIKRKIRQPLKWWLPLPQTKKRLQRPRQRYAPPTLQYLDHTHYQQRAESSQLKNSAG